MLTIRIALLSLCVCIGMTVQAQPETIINRLEAALKRAKGPDRKANLICQIADIQSQQKQYTSAIENYEKSLKLYEKALKKAGNDLKPEIMLTHMKKALTHLQLDELKTGLLEYQKAAAFYPDQYPEEVSLLYNKGYAHNCLGDKLSFFKLVVLRNLP